MSVVEERNSANKKRRRFADEARLEARLSVEKRNSAIDSPREDEDSTGSPLDIHLEENYLKEEEEEEEEDQLSLSRVSLSEKQAE